jgi:hypothetical protein
MRTTVATIDLKTKMFSGSLHARLIWQELYNIYCREGANKTNLDHLLIDYDSLKEHIEKCSEDRLELWWAVFDAKHAMTVLGDKWHVASSLCGGEKMYRILLDRNQEYVIITEYVVDDIFN